jgi:hypothetical protein
MLYICLRIKEATMSSELFYCKILPVLATKSTKGYRVASALVGFLLGLAFTFWRG